MVAEGDIVVASLPQSDGSVKLRPVLLLRVLPGFGDFLVAGISSQIRQAVPDFDIVIDEASEYFSATGLQMSSVARLTFLASVPRGHMKRKLGAIPPDLLSTLQDRLGRYLIPEARTRRSG